MFELYETLEEETYYIMDLDLSMLLLMDDRRYPWLILVPKKEGILDIHDLSLKDSIRLMKEIHEISEMMNEMYDPDNINVACLGNNIRQLHVHMIARFADDPSWPHDVWDEGQNIPYSNDTVQFSINKFIKYLTKKDDLEI